MGRNSAYGPNLVEIDHSLVKIVKLTEYITFSSRKQFFNLSSRSHFELTVNDIPDPL